MEWQKFLVCNGITIIKVFLYLWLSGMTCRWKGGHFKVKYRGICNYKDVRAGTKKYRLDGSPKTKERIVPLRLRVRILESLNFLNSLISWPEESVLSTCQRKTA